MSTVNWELVKDALIPGGPILTLAGKGWFDRRVRKLAEKQSVADTELTEAQTTKIDVESAKVITEVAITLLAPLKKELSDLRIRVDALEDERDSLAGKLRRAIAYIKELRFWVELRNLGEEPPPMPVDLQA